MIIVSLHRVNNAIRYLNSVDGNLWMVIGGTAVWPDDNNPPLPEKATTSVNTPIGAVKATVEWVVADPEGEYIFNTSAGETYWTAMSDEAEARVRNCKWVLMRGSVSSTLPLTTFREIGFFSGLTPAAGHESETVLLPSEIDDYGYLESLEYRRPVSRDSGSTYTLSNIIEF